MCSVLVAANLVACGAGTGSANEEVKQSAYSQDNMVQTSIEKELSSKSTLPINTRQETVYDEFVQCCNRSVNIFSLLFHILPGG